MKKFLSFALWVSVYTAWVAFIVSGYIGQVGDLAAAVISAVLGAIWLAAIRMDWVRIYDHVPNEKGWAA